MYQAWPKLPSSPGPDSFGLLEFSPRPWFSWSCQSAGLLRLDWPHKPLLLPAPLPTTVSSWSPSQYNWNPAGLGIPSRSKWDPGLTFTSRPFYHGTWSPMTCGLRVARFHSGCGATDTAHPPSPNQDPNSLCHRPGARHTDVAPSLAYDSVFHLQDFAQRVPSTSEVPLLLLCPQDTPAYVTARGSANYRPWATPLTVWLS